MQGRLERRAFGLRQELGFVEVLLQAVLLAEEVFSTLIAKIQGHH